MSIALLTMAAIGTLALALTTILGYIVPRDPSALSRHFVLGLGATTLLVMAHSFIMFFLIATGVELKNMERELGWGDSFRRRTIAMKSRAFPAMTMALLLVMANFIVGAAAHTRVVPSWVHEGLAWGTLASCVFTLFREWAILGDNNRLMDEATRRRSASGPPRPRADPQDEGVPIS